MSHTPLFHTCDWWKAGNAGTMLLANTKTEDGMVWKMSPSCLVPTVNH